MFSYLHEFNGFKLENELIKCYITRTNDESHQVVWNNLHLLPELYGNEGKVVQGPRYCPSIEKKLVKFPDRPSHLIWLEKEGLDTDYVYPNGLTTGLPFDLQKEMIKKIPGLE